MSTSVMALTQVFSFRGSDLAFREVEPGSWVVAAKDVAHALGYSDARKVSNLYNRHSDEFKPGEASVLTLRTEHGTRKILCFSARGAMRVALHATTDVAAEFRDFALDVLEKLHAGSRLVSPEAFRALQQNVTELARQNDLLVQQNRLQHEQIMGLTKAQIESAKLNQLVVSHAGQVLAFARHNPLTQEEQLRRALATEMNERASGVGFLTPAPSETDILKASRKNGGQS